MLLLKKLANDHLFHIALVAGPIFWLFWFLHLGIDLNLKWPRNRLFTFFLLTTIYPVLEEIVFRGALQGWLRRWEKLSRNWKELTLSNVFTSLIFSIFHLFYNSLGVSISVFIPSLIFGIFRDRYKQVLPSIFLHIFYNVGFVWLFFGSI